MIHLPCAIQHLFVWLLVCCACQPAWVLCAELTPSVEVRLKQAAVIHRSLVTIADVADLKGGTAEQRGAIGALDVAELSEASSSETVRRSQVQLRLRLAGIDPEGCEVTGATETSVSRRSEALGDEAIIAAVRDPLATHWGVAPPSLQLRLVRPLTEAVRAKLDTNGDMELRPFLPATSLPGRLQLSIGVYRSGQLLQTFPVALDAELTRRVAVARQDLRPGQKITADDVVVEQKTLSGRTAINVAEDVIGQIAARGIRAGSVLERTDVQFQLTSPREDARPYTVPRRTVVRLVARKPGLLVTVRAAELLDEGRIGDTVRVRNLSSNKVITGRLVDPTEVEVSF